MNRFIITTWLFLLLISTQATSALAQNTPGETISPLLTDSLRILIEGVPADDMHLIRSLPASAQAVYSQGLGARITVTTLPIGSHSGYKLTNSAGVEIGMQVFSVDKAELELARMSTDPREAIVAQGILRDMSFRQEVHSRAVTEYGNAGRELKKTREDIQILEAELEKINSEVTNSSTKQQQSQIDEIQRKLQTLKLSEVSLNRSEVQATGVYKEITNRYYSGSISKETQVYYTLSGPRYNSPIEMTMIHDYHDAFDFLEKELPGSVFKGSTNSNGTKSFIVSLNSDTRSMLVLLEFNEKLSRLLTRPITANGVVSSCTALFK